MWASYSDAELLTVLDKVWRRTYRDFCGGFDWPTFRVVFPHRASVYRDIQNELQRRAGR